MLAHRHGRSPRTPLVRIAINHRTLIGHTCVGYEEIDAPVPIHRPTGDLGHTRTISDVGGFAKRLSPPALPQSPPAGAGLLAPADQDDSAVLPTELDGRSLPYPTSGPGDNADRGFRHDSTHLNRW